MLSARPAILLLAVLSVCLHLAGAPPARVFTTDDGLVRNWVHRIKRDRQGMLWFCTADGISIFDGKAFTNFTTRDGLPDRSVFDFVHTADGSYWLATSVGLVSFNPRVSAPAGHFERPANFGGMGPVQVMVEDSSGDLWAGSKSQLYVLKKLDGFRPIAVDLPNGGDILSLAEDRNKRLWIGAEGGLFVRQPDGSIAQVGRERGIRRVRALLTDQRGSVWVAGMVVTEIADEDGTMVFKQHREMDALHWLGVHALHEDGNGHIWIGGFGLQKFDPAKRTLTDMSAGIPSGKTAILTLSTDPYGNLWTNHTTVGAQRLSRAPMEEITERQGVPLKFIAGFFESRKQRVFAVTDSPRHLYEFDGAYFKRFDIHAPQVPPGHWGWGIGPVALQDRAGGWWLASGAGVVRFAASDDPRTLATTTPRVYTTRDGLPENMILRLFEDSQGNIWAGCPSGLAKWHRSTGLWTRVALPPASTHTVYSFAEDKSGAVWVGIGGPMLVRFRGERAERIPLNVERGYVSALLIDRAGRLWVGTTAKGIGSIADPTVEAPGVVFVTAAHGLSSDQVHFLTQDKSGRILVATGRGVDRFDPNTRAIRHFNSSSGLPRGDVQVGLAATGGDIWFGSPSSGLARYSGEPEREEAPPPPMFRMVSVNGVPRPVSALGETHLQNLSLSPGQDTLVIQYRAADFAPDSRIRYQFRLDGDWSAPSDRESLELVRLPPGNYRFEVRAVGQSGIAGPIATLSFDLAAPLWQRWWALTTAAIVLAACVYALHVYRVNHLIMVERVRSRLATDLHDDLGAGLAEISILSELAKRRKQDAAVLDQLGHRARSLRASLSDIVWAVDPRCDRLSDVVDRMRDTAYRLLESEECSVQFSAPTREVLQAIEVPSELRRHLLLFFKEAVTNVAKHARASMVWLKISALDGVLTVQVRDNGIGINPNAPNSGYGMNSFRSRAGEMGASFEMDSAPGAGTSVQLIVPLRPRLASSHLR